MPISVPKNGKIVTLLGTPVVAYRVPFREHDKSHLFAADISRKNFQKHPIIPPGYVSIKQKRKNRGFIKAFGRILR